MKPTLSKSMFCDFFKSFTTGTHLWFWNYLAIFLYFFLLTDYRLITVRREGHREELEVYRDCACFKLHRQIVFATMDAVLEHHHTMRAQFKGMLCRFSKKFMRTLHLNSYKHLSTLLLFPHPVIKFIVFTEKVLHLLTRTSASRSFKAHTNVCYITMSFLVPCWLEKPISFMFTENNHTCFVGNMVHGGVSFHVWKNRMFL